MHIKRIAKIKNGYQDGAFFGKYYFRFNSQGNGIVYHSDDIINANGKECEPYDEFVLDGIDRIVPHSNSVVFGNEYYNSEDEFPLLYTNIYNNYAKKDNPLKGVCLVYRIQRDNKKFSTTLVQMIEIGFVNNENLWISGEDTKDIRPYGNFVIDTKNNKYYAFVMRDKTRTTRYFSFNLPKVHDGDMDETFRVKKVVLNECDIKEYFDCEYHDLIQGACLHNGKIYSTEGFSAGSPHQPTLRVIDINEKKQVLMADFGEIGANEEPEMIDFYNDVCYYGDAHGNIYTIDL